MQVKIHSPETCFRATGSSGGSLVAATLILDADIIAVKNFMLLCMKHLNSKPATNTFKLRNYIEAGFKLVSIIEREKGRNVNVAEYESIKQKRLGISVTTLDDFCNHVMIDYEEQREVEEAIVASCAISPMAGLPFRLTRPHDAKLHKRIVGDGGYTTIQPVTCNNANMVVKISTFHTWDSDIKPSKFVPIWWSFLPPSTNELEELFYLGVSDTLAYLSKEDVMQKFTTLSNENRIYLGQELADLIKADHDNSSFANYMKNPIYEHRSDTNFATLTKLSKKQVELFKHPALKTAAFGSIMAEYAAQAAFNLARGVTVAAEHKRRKFIAPSSFLGSIRLWIPDQLLGHHTEYFEKSYCHISKLADPWAIWKEINETFEHSRDISDTDSDISVHTFSSEQSLGAADKGLLDESFIFKHFVA